MNFVLSAKATRQFSIISFKQVKQVEASFLNFGPRKINFITKNDKNNKKKKHKINKT